MSGTPSFTRCAEKLVKAFEQAEIDYMFIGGLALPAYGHIRATQDIDTAIAVKNVRSLQQLLDNLKEQRFETAATARIEAACIYLFDRENLVDVEVWPKPNGVRFDEDCYLNEGAFRCLPIFESG